MHLGVPAAKVSYVRLKTFRIKPAEHPIEFFAQNQPDHRLGKLLELNRLPEHATEDLRSFGIGKLATGNLQIESDEFFRALKSQGRESADIVGCDCLIKLVGTDGVISLPFKIPISTWSM